MSPIVCRWLKSFVVKNYGRSLENVLDVSAGISRLVYHRSLEPNFNDVVFIFVYYLTSSGFIGVPCT